MPMPTIRWSVVSPAVTTQFREDFSLDLDATGRVIEGLLADGVSGLIIAGTVGENCSLSKAEKLALLETAVDVTRRRVPVLFGIAEYTTTLACDMAREARRLGADGAMVMPALVYATTVLRAKGGSAQRLGVSFSVASQS